MMNTVQKTDASNLVPLSKTFTDELKISCFTEPCKTPPMVQFQHTWCCTERRHENSILQMMQNWKILAHPIKCCTMPFDYSM